MARTPRARTSRKSSHGLSQNWRPDWTNHAAYLPPTGDSLQWAWEFLRRSDAYQLDWQLFCSIPPPSDWDAAPVNSYLWCEPDALAGETKSEWLRRLGARPRSDTALSVHLARRYGLLLPALHDPAEKLAPRFESAARVTAYRQTHDGGPQALRLTPTTALVHVDLRLPIRGQLAAVAPKLDALAEKDSAARDGLSPLFERVAFKEQPANWPFYLRAMDAAAAGYRPNAIAARIAAGPARKGTPRVVTEATVNNWLRAGRRIARADYKLMAGCSP